MSNPYTIKIGGVQQNIIAGTLDATNQIGQRSTGSVQVWTPLATTWQYGTQVQIYNGNGTKVYAGFTTTDQATKATRQGVGYLEHTVQLVDNCYKADKRVIFGSYLNQSAGSIVSDLLNRVLVQEGVTATPTSIAAGVTIVEVVWNGKQISSALDWLATQSGFWWQIDVNGVLWFQPYDGVPSPNTIDGTQVDLTYGNLQVTFGNDIYVVRQYAKGAYDQTGWQTETFHGDGVRTNFTLNYEIASSSPGDNTIELNGGAQTYDAKGNSGADWYIAVGDSVVSQDSSGTVLGSGDTLTVIYKGRFPVLAMAANPALITAQQAREGAGGSGIVESVYADTKVHSLPAAFQIAQSLLAHYGQDATLLQFDTLQSGFAAGQSVLVNLPDFALNTMPMLIQSVEMTDGQDNFQIWYRVKCIGGAVEVASWTTYWQNLMNQSADPSDLSDTADTSLALLLSTYLTRTPSVTITMTKTTCPICGNSTLCGNSTIIC